ncbi:hydantoinase/oxoprolinase family protein [Gephyromycinifex aptenodytis]|uniref:hydantoinase/oxoprolinase family protein n=1 Tax=Gephyromycinifex aptenodytis TaxID=2716227 RepID=UPI0014461DB7|nr:hydantoinase/oxoprolinase family protein [Gephyromycinifex aptenodytis]
MDTLINIDNGGTLTDICVWDGDEFTFTKTLTTPFDLSQCLFDGIEKASATMYGQADLERLLHEAAHIRYSTTQGTNALVERKGPPIGLLIEDEALVEQMRQGDRSTQLFDDLIGNKVAHIELGTENLEFDLVQKLNKLTTDGAARVVIVGKSRESEKSIKHIVLRKFPRHLLGSVPVLYSWDFIGDRTAHRRAWSCVVNSFLHPTMEGFLYGAQHRLNTFKVSNPLLVYRNDGQSSRVAKAVALKTYSSGPRGGLEGTLALARSYDLPHVLMMDVGGTTTDVGVIDEERIDTDRRGTVGGVPISFPMSNVHSFGVGGSSIIALDGDQITVGPRSVGAAPGPACFGLGGTDPTITDVNVLLGVLDPDTYLDGTFQLDPARSQAVITEKIADPLGIDLPTALTRMEQAYFEAMAQCLRGASRADSVLAAFGGAGPMSACGAARLAGISRVLIPRMAAVFSAFGISFSDIGKTYEVGVPEPTSVATEATHDDIYVRAERDMFQEGYSLEECELHWYLSAETEDGELLSFCEYIPGAEVETFAQGNRLALRLVVSKALPHPSLDAHQQVPAVEAVSCAQRSLRDSDGVKQVPVYLLDEQPPGAQAEGPAIVEGPFFTARLLPGWRMQVTATRDLIFTDTQG